jgi:serine/threonine protein kinase
MSTVYTLDEIEWGTINKNLFVKRLTQPIPNRPYTSYLEAHYHRKITNLNIPNILKLSYLYENLLPNSLNEFWMIFETQTLDIKRNLQNFIEEHQQQNRTISLRKNFEIILPIINALTELHENELVHRNIKLSNILLDQNDESCLADLGNWSLLNTDQSIHVEWRHYLSKNSDGILKDIQDFGQLSFTLCSIINSDDLKSSICGEYKQILGTCLSNEPPRTGSIRQDLKDLYDNLNRDLK